MKRVIIGILIGITLVMVGIAIFYSKSTMNKKEQIPKRLVAEFVFGNQGKGLGEFNRPTDVAVKDDFLFVADSGNSRIQVFKINPNASLVPISSFGKEGKGLGEFKYPSSFAERENYLFVADAGNNRIQVLEIR